MENQHQKKQTLLPRRVFSEQVRRQIVHDIEAGTCSVIQASREVSVSPQSIYKWINRYSRYLKSNKTLVVEEKSESYRSKQLEARVKELEAALGRKQMEIDLLNKVIDLASEEYQTDLKKNLSSRPSSGSGEAKGKNTDTK